MAQHGFIQSQKGSEPPRQEQGWGIHFGSGVFPATASVGMG